MKCYYYGPPSLALPRAVEAAKRVALWLRFPAVFLVVLLWIVLMPVAYVLVHAGNLGHAIAGFCGFESRGW